MPEKSTCCIHNPTKTAPKPARTLAHTATSGPKPMANPRSTRAPAALDVVLVDVDVLLELEPEEWGVVVVLIPVPVDVARELVPPVVPFVPTVASAA